MDDLISGEFFVVLLNVGIIIFAVAIKNATKKSWMHPDVFVYAALGWLGLFTSALHINGTSDAAPHISLIGFVIVVFTFVNFFKERSSGKTSQFGANNRNSSGYNY